MSRNFLLLILNAAIATQIGLVLGQFSCPSPELASPCSCTIPYLNKFKLTCSALEFEDIRQTFQNIAEKLGTNVAIIYLQNTNLEVLPAGSIPEFPLDELHINDNLYLHHISSLALGSTTYESVQTLEITNSPELGAPSSNLFYFLDQFEIMRWVTLQNLNLKTIPHEFFAKPRPDIVTLNLAGNPIVFSENTNFSGLYNLAVLYLSDTSMTNENFANFPTPSFFSHTNIYLDNNPELTYLDEIIFKPLLDTGAWLKFAFTDCSGQLCEETVGNNYMICDERADWLCLERDSYIFRVDGYNCGNGSVWDYCSIQAGKIPDTKSSLCPSAQILNPCTCNGTSATGLLMSCENTQETDVAMSKIIYNVETLRFVFSLNMINTDIQVLQSNTFYYFGFTEILFLGNLALSGISSTAFSGWEVSTTTSLKIIDSPLLGAATADLMQLVSSFNALSTLELTGLSLGSIPTDLDVSGLACLQALSLNNNDLSNQDLLFLQYLTSLTYLDVSNNTGLNYLDQNIFEPLMTRGVNIVIDQPVVPMTCDENSDWICANVLFYNHFSSYQCESGGTIWDYCNSVGPSEHQCPSADTLSPCICEPRANQVIDLICKDTQDTGGALAKIASESVPKKFDNLVISNTDIETLPTGTFTFYTFNTIAIVNNSALSDVSPTAFGSATFGVTTKLIIKGSPLLGSDSSNVVNLVANFQVLQSLTLNFLELGTISNALFGSPMPDLITLDLSYNSLSFEETPDFSGLSNIKIITLRGNNLSTENCAAFKDLSKLTKLDLTNNPGITSLDEDTFEPLLIRNVKFFVGNCNDNGDCVAPVILCDVTAEWICNMQTNYVQYLNGYTCTTGVDLSEYCQVENQCPDPATLSPCICDSQVGFGNTLTCQDTINMADVLTSIAENQNSSKTFMMLTLDNTDLEVLPADAFPLFTFTQILLTNNRALMEISPTAFKSAKTAALFISSSPLLANNPDGLFNFVASFPALTVLALSNLTLTSIPINFFATPRPSLIQLDLSLNSLTFDENQDLSGLTNIMFLILQNNEFTNEDLACLEGLTSLGYLFIANNPDLTYLEETVFNPLFQRRVAIYVGSYDSTGAPTMACDSRADWICPYQVSYTRKLSGFVCPTGTVWDYCNSLTNSK